MMKVYEQHESSVIGGKEVPWEHVSRYGLVAGNQDAGARGEIQLTDGHL